MASNPLTAELHVVPVLILRYKILTVYSFWSTTDFIVGGLTSQALVRTASTGYRLQTTFVVKAIKEISVTDSAQCPPKKADSLCSGFWVKGTVSHLRIHPITYPVLVEIHVCFWFLTWFVLHCDQMKIETYLVTMVMHALGFESTLNVEKREPSRTKLQ